MTSVIWLVSPLYYRIRGGPAQRVFRCPDQTPQNAAPRLMPSGGIADKWTPILEALTEKGVLRFTRLSELVEGVSQKMLTQTVGHMEHDGLIANYDVSAGHSPR